jgi:hypothetical protein
VLAFAREPGGADAIAPVVQRIRQRGRAQVVLLAKDFAVERFRAAGLEFEKLEVAGPNETLASVERLLERIDPGLLLTSASSRPRDDMTEKWLWRAGQRRGIPSLAVLDQWQNYSLRFSGPGVHEYLAFMPSVIAVMDEGVRRQMVAEGIPAEKVWVSGHPRFDRLREFRATTQKEICRRRLAELGVETDGWVVIFVSEPASRFFAGEEGYDECGTLDQVLIALDQVAQRSPRRLSAIVKHHPRNLPEDFADLRFPTGEAALAVHHLTSQIDPWTLLLAADLVVGMISILLVDAVLLEVPTVSVQIGARNPGRCIAEQAGAIRAVGAAEELGPLLADLLANEENRRRYLERQRTFRAPGKAVDAIEARVYQLLGA